MQRAARGIATVFAGALTFLALHLFFLLTWSRLFLVAPWPGYEESARVGLIEAWFVNTPRSLWLTRITFFGLALVSATVRRSGRWQGALLIGLGAASGVIGTYATTSMPAMPSGGLGYVIYPFRLLLPIVLGTALGGATHRFRTRRRAPRATEVDGAP